MSTRSTLKSHRDDTGVGFQLFTDWLDECKGLDVVGLRLDGMEFNATCEDGHLSVEVRIPRAMAEKLGLLAGVPSGALPDFPSK